MADYPPATIFLDNTKNKRMVSVTIPKHLRTHYNGRSQVKRSTGTSDQREAKTRLHAIAADIYSEFESYEPDPVREALASLWKATKPADIKVFSHGELPRTRYDPEDQNCKDATDQMLDLVSMDCKNLTATGDFDSAEAAQDFLKFHKDFNKEIGATDSRRKLSDIIDEYSKAKTYSRIKDKKSALNHIKEFVSFSEDISINDINKTIAYKYCEMLHEQEKAKSTIKTRISDIKGILKYAERQGYIESNPWIEMDFSTYGRKRSSYIPLGIDNLHKLLGQKLPIHIRLLFSILITTGMRLDEAALLTHDDIKNEGGIRYFDLTDKANLLKNIGSARKVPIVDALKLPTATGQGRLFPMWRVDADGKAQSAASKEGMPFIKNVSDNTKHVIHSLRGDFKDLCRDAQIPKETQDFITGHGSGDVAGRYGSGPSLSTRYKAMNKIKHPWLEY